MNQENQKPKGKLDAAISEWLDGLSCMDSSKNTYIRVLRSWNKWLMNNKHYNAMGATRFDVHEFRDSLIKTKEPHTVCHYLSVLRMFYRFLSINYGKTDIMSGIRGVKRQKYGHKQTLSDERLIKLFGSIDRTTEIGCRDYLVLMLMVRAGLRRMEISLLDAGDMVMMEGTASLRLQRKGHITKDSMIPIADDVRDAILDYEKWRKPKKGEPLILTNYNRNAPGRIGPEGISEIAKRRMTKAGIIGDGLSAHSLRHTFGCMLVDAGTPMDEVQALMGHSSIDATMIYVRMAADRKLFRNNPANRFRLPVKPM